MKNQTANKNLITLIIVAIAIALIIFIFSFFSFNRYGMMSGYGGCFSSGYGYMGFFGIFFMVLIVIAIISFTIWMLNQLQLNKPSKK